MSEETPQPTHRNVIHLRVPEEIIDRLQTAAEAHHTTVVAEIRARLVASFDRDVRTTFADLAHDIAIHWARFTTRFSRVDLGDALAEAVVRNDNPETIKMLARAVIDHRDQERRAVAHLGSVS